MTRKEAVAIADKFVEDLPHLANRSCRVREDPPSGYNAYGVWYRVSRGPKGGIGKSRLLTSVTSGASVFFAMETGDVVMKLSVVNGWKSYHSFVVLPFMENHDYQRPFFSAFSLEEKLESAKWYKQFCDPEDLYWLDDLICTLAEDIQCRDAPRRGFCGEGLHADTECPY